MRRFGESVAALLDELLEVDAVAGGGELLGVVGAGAGV